MDQEYDCFPLYWSAELTIFIFEMVWNLPHELEIQLQVHIPDKKKVFFTFTAYCIHFPTPSWPSTSCRHGKRLLWYIYSIAECAPSSSFECTCLNCGTPWSCLACVVYPVAEGGFVAPSMLPLNWTSCHGYGSETRGRMWPTSHVDKKSN